MSVLGRVLAMRGIVLEGKIICQQLSEAMAIERFRNIFGLG